MFKPAFQRHQVREQIILQRLPFFPPMRNASVEKRVKSNTLQITNTTKPKTSTTIREIL